MNSAIASITLRNPNERPIATRRRRCRVVAIDRVGSTPESKYLRGWIAGQAARYQELLLTIAFSPPSIGRS
jgi:hypothetical protein